MLELCLVCVDEVAQRSVTIGLECETIVCDNADEVFVSAWSPENQLPFHLKLSVILPRETHSGHFPDFIGLLGLILQYILVDYLINVVPLLA